MEIGFIGLGKMGFPMARRLVEAGHKLTVFDTQTAAVDRLVALGAKAGASPKDIQNMFRKRAQIDAVEAVKPEDIEIEKEGDQVILRAAYSTKIKLFGNLNACIDFVATNGN